MRSFLAFICLFFVMLMPSQSIWSACPNTIDEFDPPCSTEVLTLDFGTVIRPLSGTQQIFIARNNGTIDSGSTTLEYPASSTTSQGEIDVGTNKKGPANQTRNIRIDFQEGSMPTGIDFTNFEARYLNTTVNDDGSIGYLYEEQAKGSTKALTYGSTLEVSSAATPGLNILLPYNVELEYSTDCAPNCNTTVPRQALVDVIVPISLNAPVGEQLDFGAASKPTANSTVRVDVDGNLSVVSGPILLLSGNARAGIIEITAQENQVIDISASISAGPNGLSLANLAGRYNGATLIGDLEAGGSVTAANGTIDLEIGGDMDVSKSVAIGSYTINYDLIVNYQ